MSENKMPVKDFLLLLTNKLIKITDNCIDVETQEELCNLIEVIQDVAFKTE